MRSIVVIAHDIRSCHNVGSLLRTAEGLGIDTVCLTGYTPYPIAPDDSRLPHIAQHNQTLIAKTALGAEQTQPWQQENDVLKLLQSLENDGYSLCALEQSDVSIPLPEFLPGPKTAILLGSEVTGIEQSLLKMCPTHLEIPMFGKKESFNVVEAASMAIYHCRFAPLSARKR